ncbi:hypothetical protein D3C71_1646070 [compost metagenome]
MGMLPLIILFTLIQLQEVQFVEEHIKAMRMDRPGHVVKRGEYTDLPWLIVIRRMRIFLLLLKAWLIIL